MVDICENEVTGPIVPEQTLIAFDGELIGLTITWSVVGVNVPETNVGGFIAVPVMWLTIGFWDNFVAGSAFDNFIVGSAMI